MVTKNPRAADGENDRGRIGDNSKADPGQPAIQIQTVAVESLSVWEPAQEQANDCHPHTLQTEADIVSVAGQRVPVPAREREDGSIEVIGKAHIVDAVRRYNQQHSDAVVGVQVRVYRSCSDEQAFGLLAQDAEPGHEPSSLARGQLFMRAIARFGGIEEAAAKCRVSKAAVSKNLDVARCIPIVGEKVQVQRDISQRDATWVMQVVGREADGSDAPDQGVRSAVLTHIATAELAPAKKLFAALRTVVSGSAAARPRKGQLSLVHEGREIGTVLPKKGGVVVINLVGTGDVELDTVMALVREAMELTRR